jgi:uncharacterized phage-associated protein
VPYTPQIPDWFNTRKAAQVVAWFAMQSGGRINILKATKLVYLADRESMRTRDCPITGDNFVSMQFGPVNTNTYRYMRGEARARQDQWSRYVGRRDGHNLPLAGGVSESDLDELSRADLRVLRAVWEVHKDVDRFDLAQWTHKYCPEWRDPSGSSIPIEFATVYKTLEREDPVSLAEEIQAERGLRLRFLKG